MIKKIILLLLILIAIILIKTLGLTEYLTLDYIKQNQESFYVYYQKNQFITVFIYFAIYIITTALSIPGATVLTLLGGALFGLSQGLVIISFASSVGATLAFLFSRTLFRDSVEKKFKNQINKLNKGIEKEGAFYLFTLRLVPLFPFFLINMGMGLTRIKTLVFYLVSQIGMLPGTFVYVNAGVQLSKIDSLKAALLSPEVLVSFRFIRYFSLCSLKGYY
jgi:uncharacterized membrane protein YdjX (TVP38/TMEM64 family)